MRDRTQPQYRTRVLLDESEIQRRRTEPKWPSLAELYATETQRAQRDRYYSDHTDRFERAADSLRYAETIWLTRPVLHARGWTDTAIRDFLPKPERYRKRPRRKGSTFQTALWSARTVARAEATTTWRRWLEDSLKKRHLTMQDITAIPRGTSLRHSILEAEAAITAFQSAKPEDQ